MNDLIARLREQFEAQYEVQPNGCWLWTGPIHTAGYGRMKVFGGLILAHRFSYELHVGPIPEGLDLHHLCCNKPCVNSAHLEPVTRRENVLRGNGLAAQNVRKTQCSQGHPYDEENTYVHEGTRYCRECVRATSRERYRELNGVAPAQQRGPYRRQPVKVGA